MNGLIARIDSLRFKMNELNECYDLVMQLTQQTEIRRFKRDRGIIAAKLDGIEKQRRQVSRDVDNVRGVIEAAREFCDLMSKVIEHLKPLEARHRKEAA